MRTEYAFLVYIIMLGYKELLILEKARATHAQHAECVGRVV